MISIKADNVDMKTFDLILSSHVDVTGAEHVEVTATANLDTLWVNVNGVCILRVCRIKHLQLNLGATSELPTSPSTLDVEL